jgi:hypothetical protein
VAHPAGTPKGVAGPAVWVCGWMLNFLFGLFPCVACIVYCAVCIVLCILSIVYCALCTVHYVLCIVLRQQPLEGSLLKARVCEPRGPNLKDSLRKTYKKLHIPISYKICFWVIKPRPPGLEKTKNGRVDFGQGGGFYNRRWGLGHEMLLKQHRTLANFCFALLRFCQRPQCTFRLRNA